MNGGAWRIIFDAQTRSTGIVQNGLGAATKAIVGANALKKKM